MRPLLLGAMSLAAMAQTPSLPLMPWPEQITVTQDRLRVAQDFSVRTEGQVRPRVREAIARTLARIEGKTGAVFTAASAKPAVLVRYSQDSPDIPVLGTDESYRLSVTSQNATLTAQTDLGVLRGLETLIQLVAADGSGFYIPGVTIDDRPRFPWRGLMLDASRHWMPLEVVKRTLDGMAAVKFNVFHWHLSDDQGFRVESRKQPKLQELGSDGNYYTHDQVREVIRYAANLGIRVVPEFDIPGHTTSWLAAYPELGTMPGPYQIERAWGIMDPTLDPTKEAVYSFLDSLLGEMAGLFPDAYFHIGGDEVNGKHWSAAEHVTAFKQAKGLKDNHALQSYFTRRVQEIVAKHGKRMEGWDEILSPDIPKNIVVQSWRGQKSLGEAAREGFDGILSAGYYLDLIQPASQHYAVDPLEGPVGTLTAEQRKRILGGEACMWSEYVNTETVDSRIWPRAAAIAERLWSPQAVKDPASMYKRLDAESMELERLGLRHRSNYGVMLERIAGSSDIAALRTLADVVEPVKGYARGSLRKHTQFTPLNRLVDAARPESDTARNFGELVDAYLRSRDAAAREQLRAWLTRWRDNDALLQARSSRNFLYDEALSVSAQLKSAAAIGLAALERKLPPDAASELKKAWEPRGELLVMVAPHIRKLVEDAAH